MVGFLSLNNETYKYSKEELTEKQLAQKQRDELRTKQLIEKGYNVIRLWENEIKPMTIKQFEERLIK